MRYRYHSGEHEYSIDLELKGDIYTAHIGDQTIEFCLLQSEPGRFTFLVGQSPIAASVALDGTRRWVAVQGRTFECTIVDANAAAARARDRRSGAAGGERLVLAPMPGQVRAVSVEPRQSVARGQTLLLLEAMKMEIRVQAPRDARVARLLVQPGQTVDRDQVLVELETDEK